MLNAMSHDRDLVRSVRDHRRLVACQCYRAVAEAWDKHALREASQRDSDSGRKFVSVGHLLQLWFLD